MLMLKRSRLRPKNEGQTNQTTVTTVEPPPILNTSVTEVPHFGVGDLQVLEKITKSQKFIASAVTIRPSPQIKSTTTESLSLVTRRYETPPPRSKHLPPLRIPTVSKESKKPKLHLTRVNILVDVLKECNVNSEASICYPCYKI